MPSNPYAAPAALLSPSDSKDLLLYTPNQVAAGSFFGGPVAAIYFLHANFKQLGALEAARQTLIIGVVMLVALVGVVAALPEDFPSISITVVTTLAARYLAERYQMSKQAIFDSGHYFQSNWKVAGMAILWTVLSLGAVFVVVFLLAALGLIS